MKTRSLSIVNPQERQKLKLHLLFLVKKQQEIIQEKLRRQRQKQDKRKQMQIDFVKWVYKKQQIIKEKIDKSYKNKKQQINKIVKKCKQHEKYIGQKLKNYHIKIKTSLINAWKKVQQLNRTSQKQHKQQSFKKRTSQRINTEGNINSSILVSVKYEVPQQDKAHLTTQNFNQNHIINVQIPTYNKHQPFSNNQASHLNDKIMHALQKFRQYTEEDENIKIQQLGQRLDKIEKTRLKKIQIIRQKRRNSHPLTDFTIKERNNENKLQHKSKEKYIGESKTPEKRIKDWSSHTKIKRQQLLQTHLKNGNQYLQYQKLKYLRTRMEKQIVMQALQRKLYHQRLINQ